MATYRSATQNAAAVTGTAGLTINIPSGVANGDTLIAFIGAGDEAGGAYACSGWSQASGTGTGAQATSAQNDIGSTVLYKYISNAAGEPSSYTFTNTDTAQQNRSGFIVCVQDTDSADPIDELTQSAGTNDWTPNTVSITSGSNGCCLLFFHVGNTGSVAAKTAGAPSGTTLIGSIAESRTGSLGGYSAAEAAYLNQTSAGTFAATAWTGTTDEATSEWHVYSVAVRASTLTRTAGPETLKLSDSVSVLLTPLEANKTETLKLSDSVEASLPLAQSTSDALKLSDRGTVGLIGALRISDGFDLNATTVGGEAALTREAGPETLKLSEALAAEITPLEASRSETLRVSDSSDLNANTGDLTRPANPETLRLSDTVTAEMTPLEASRSETVTLSDTSDLNAALGDDLLRDVTADALRIADAGTIGLIGALRVQDGFDLDARTVDTGALTREAGAETLKLAEALAAEITPLERSASETLKLSDAAAAQITPLEASGTETLKLSDSAQAAITLVASATETLTLSDTASAQLTPLEASATETLKLSESASAQITPLEAVGSETLKLAESLAVARDLTISESETLTLSDAAAAELTILEASASETLRLTDGPDLNALPVAEGTLTREAGPETLTLSDAVSATLTPLEVSQTEALRLAEVCSAEVTPLEVAGSETLTLGEALAASIGLEATASDTLKLSESLTAVLTPLEASLSETIVLSETVVTTLTPLEAVLSEALTLSDTSDLNAVPVDGEALTRTVGSDAIALADRGTIALIGALKISDGFDLDAQVVGDNTLSRDVGYETLRLRDEVRTDLSVQLTETLRLSDATGNWASLWVPETLKLSDVVVAALTPLEVSASETLRLADMDPLTGSLLVGNPDPETLRLAESLSAQITPLEASTVETLRLADTPSARLTPLEVSAIDTLRLSDTVEATQGLARPVADEALRLSDTVGAQLTPLEVSASETLRVADTTPEGTTQGEGVTASETLRLSDVVLAHLTPLEAAPSAETLRLSDVASVGGVLTREVPSESLVISDSVEASLPALRATAGPETLRLSDSVTVEMADLVVNLTETVRMRDDGVLYASTSDDTLLFIGLEEHLSLGDSTPTAIRDLWVRVTAETLSLGDGPLTVQRTVLEVEVAPETLRLAESLVAQRPGLTLWICLDPGTPDAAPTASCTLDTLAAESTLVAESTEPAGTAPTACLSGEE